MDIKTATTSEFNGVVSCGTGCLFELLPPKNRLNEAFIRKMRASWHSKPGWLFHPFGAEMDRTSNSEMPLR